MKPSYAVILATGFALLGQSASAATTTTTLLNSGSTGVKFNIVVIGDGFQAGEQAAFNTEVTDKVVNGVFKNPVMSEIMNAVNLYRINVDSTDSGVTQVDANGAVTTAKNTALDMRFSGNWNRCWMEWGPNTSSRLNTILNAQVPGWNYVVMILNEPGFGGCSWGAQLGVTQGAGSNVFTHEFGHSIGKLADEYTASSDAYTGSEPTRVNCTINTNRSTLKWRCFVNPSTPIPTTCSDVVDTNQDVGLFAGCNYKATGVYRPACQCMMKGNQPDFCPICYNKIHEEMDPRHDYNFLASYPGDFNGDGKTDLVLHNANSLAYYVSSGSGFVLQSIVTGSLTGWGTIRSGDKFFVGDFDGDLKDDLYVFNGTDLSYRRFGMIKSYGDRLEGIRSFSTNHPGWAMSAGDKFLVADVDGDGKKDLYVWNGSSWSMPYLLMLKSSGSDLSYLTRFDGSMPGWSMANGDQFFVADFNGDGKKDLYVFNGSNWSMRYLLLVRSTGTGLAYVTRYDGSLPSWALSTGDKFYPGDFDGDAKEDLYVWNGANWSMPYLHMVRSTGTTLASTKYYAGSVPGWTMKPGDQWYVADVNGDAKKDVYVYNPTNWSTEYLGTLVTSGTALSGSWQADWVNGWNLGSADLFQVGNFNGGAGWQDLLVRNTDWFGMLRSSSTQVNLDSIYYKWIHNYRYYCSGVW